MFFDRDVGAVIRCLSQFIGIDQPEKYSAIQYYNQETDMFIYPGFKFSVVNKLITNFHLPKSSLFLLVSAFGGKNNMLKYYKTAIKNKMRFFSYGDGMIVNRYDEI